MYPAGLYVGQDGNNGQVFWEVGLIMQSGRAYYLQIPGAESRRIFHPSRVTSFSICCSTPSSLFVQFTLPRNILNACYYSVQTLLSSSLLSKNLKIKIYRNVILPLVLYGCETWSLILREERRLRMFENMALRKIFGPKGEEMPGVWRKLHNEKLNDLYCSPNIVRMIKSRRMRWAEHVARM